MNNDESDDDYHQQGDDPEYERSSPYLHHPPSKHRRGVERDKPVANLCRPPPFHASPRHIHQTGTGYASQQSITVAIQDA